MIGRKGMNKKKTDRATPSGGAGWGGRMVWAGWDWVWRWRGRAGMLEVSVY